MKIAPDYPVNIKTMVENRRGAPKTDSRLPAFRQNGPFWNTYVIDYYLKQGVPFSSQEPPI